MERMKLSIIGGASAVALIALISAGTAFADPKRVWLAQDGARVRVGPCGGALCATIATPKSAVDPETGRPWTDKNYPDPALRNRPLVLSITHNSCADRGAQPDIGETGQAAPHHDVPRRRIIGAREVSA